MVTDNDNFELLCLEFPQEKKRKLTQSGVFVN